VAATGRHNQARDDPDRDGVFIKAHLGWKQVGLFIMLIAVFAYLLGTGMAPPDAVHVLARLVMAPGGHP
jgi:hypothetical protein